MCVFWYLLQALVSLGLQCQIIYVIQTVTNEKLQKFWKKSIFEHCLQKGLILPPKNCFPPKNCHNENKTLQKGKDNLKKHLKTPNLKILNIHTGLHVGNLKAFFQTKSALECAFWYPHYIFRNWTQNYTGKMRHFYIFSILAIAIWPKVPYPTLSPSCSSGCRRRTWWM